MEERPAIATTGAAPGALVLNAVSATYVIKSPDVNMNPPMTQNTCCSQADRPGMADRIAASDVPM